MTDEIVTAQLALNHAVTKWLQKQEQARRGNASSEEVTEHAVAYEAAKVRLKALLEDREKRSGAGIVVNLRSQELATE